MASADPICSGFGGRYFHSWIWWRDCGDVQGSVQARDFVSWTSNSSPAGWRGQHYGYPVGYTRTRFGPSDDQVQHDFHPGSTGISERRAHSTAITLRGA